MAKIIDARTLACPEPVMLTRRALQEHAEVTTIVDNDTARENIMRFGKNEGCQVTIEHKSDGTYITLVKPEAKESHHPEIAAGSVLFLGSDVVGRGSNTGLGSLLMQKFLHTIGNMAGRPDTILLMNEGVRLVTHDSPSLSELQFLEKQGVEILACGTCLARLELTDKMAAGKISNMDEIAGKLLQAGKVISL